MQRSVSRGLMAISALALLLTGPMTASAKDRKEKPKEVEVVKEGKILVVRGLAGGEPQLTDQQDKRWLIVGPLRAETLRLGGHRIRVWATVGEKKLMTPTLKVSRYEILESGSGRKPLVGTLRQEESKTYLLERPEGKLRIKGSRSLMQRLAKRTDCKIWIAGSLEGTTLRAKTFGWISCKTPKAIKPRKESSK